MHDTAEREKCVAARPFPTAAKGGGAARRGARNGTTLPPIYCQSICAIVLAALCSARPARPEMNVMHSAGNGGDIFFPHSRRTQSVSGILSFLASGQRAPRALRSAGGRGGPRHSLSVLHLTGTTSPARAPFRPSPAAVASVVSQMRDACGQIAARRGPLAALPRPASNSPRAGQARPGQAGSKIVLRALSPFPGAALHPTPSVGDAGLTSRPKSAPP